MANTNEISVAIPIFFSTGFSLLVFMATSVHCNKITPGSMKLMFVYLIIMYL